MANDGGMKSCTPFGYVIVTTYYILCMYALRVREASEINRDRDRNSNSLNICSFV